MFGAILGDIVGSPYEIPYYNIKTKKFPLFSPHSTITDDSVMTIAVADAVMNTDNKDNDEALKRNFIHSMQLFGRRHPDAGYGGNFIKWIFDNDPQPYGSYGNGSAMRVSSVAWLFDNIDDVRRVARLSAEVSHNHPEGIKGAESTAAAVFMARSGYAKDEIKAYVTENFGYCFHRTCDEIRPFYCFDPSCTKTVPEAMTAFFESTDFEDCIRTAVSLGGDCDTLTAIAGSIAEGFYGVPEFLKTECIIRLPEDLREVVFRFSEHIR